MKPKSIVYSSKIEGENGCNECLNANWAPFEGQNPEASLTLVVRTDLVLICPMPAFLWEEDACLTDHFPSLVISVAVYLA